MVSPKGYIAGTQHMMTRAFVESRWHLSAHDLPAIHSSPEFECRLSEDASQALYSIRVEILRESCRIVPASWWQHFKRDCFPGWALKRWPVKWVKATLCIGFKPALDRHKGPVVCYDKASYEDIRNYDRA